VKFILESVENSVEILYSPELKSLLKRVSDKSRNNGDIVNVAHMLLNIEGSVKDTHTLLDITNKNDTISMLPVSRINRSISSDPNIMSDLGVWSPSGDKTLYDVALTAHMKKGGDVSWVNKMWKDQRIDVKIGRYSKRILATTDCKDSDIEKFVNLYKSEFDYLSGIKEKMTLVSGDEINKWYLSDNYESGGGSLNNSCMRYLKCQTFFGIYTKNPEVCQLLILKNDSGDKIFGRSLVWKIKDGKTYLDRVYTCKDSDVNIFKEYANEKGWVTFYDRPGNIEVQLGDHKYSEYPYTDTFVAYNTDDHYLSSDEDGARGDNDFLILQETDGRSMAGGGVWSEWHGEYLDEEDAVWCSNVNDYLHSDETVYLEYKDEFVAPTSDIAHSSHKNQSYFKGDCIWSECMEDWFLKDDDEIITLKTSASDDGDMDYCIEDRKDLYVKVGGEYFSKSACFKNPYHTDGSPEYIFKDSMINSEKFSDYLSKDILATYNIHFNENDSKAKGKLEEMVKGVLSNPPEEAIESIKLQKEYNSFLNKYELFNPLTPSDVLYYILAWSINYDQFEVVVRRGSIRVDARKIINAYDLVMKIAPEEVWERYKIYVLVGSDDVDYYQQKDFIISLSQIASKFDYSIFGIEFYKLWLFLHKI
jgi:hypothetical protein